MENEETPKVTAVTPTHSGEVEQITKLPEAPPRPDDAHKGTFGSVLVIAGSQGMSGAARLAGCAALHGGAGLVTVAVPRSILDVVALGHPSYMTVPLADRQGQVQPDALKDLQPFLQRQTAVALGPGMGQSDATREFIQQLYVDCRLPLVLDADGLNAFRDNPRALAERCDQAPRILTPHPGEFSRLTQASVAEIQANRELHTSQFAREHQVVLLLKGPQTLISDGRRMAVNTTGNSGLAKGGSGDVLTGLMASLLAQGMEAFEAAQLAAHLHGLAADSMTAQHTPQYATSLDLLRCLDEAWRAFQ